MTRPALDERIERISVREHVDACSSRPRGRRFYDVLAGFAAQLPPEAELLVSFVDAGYVSPSFLDETVVRLVEEYPDLRGRVLIEGLSGFALNGLKTVAAARGVKSTLRVQASPYSLDNGAG
jgi:hypothetical protein